MTPTIQMIIPDSIKVIVDYRTIEEQMEYFSTWSDDSLINITLGRVAYYVSENEKAAAMSVVVSRNLAKKFNAQLGAELL